MKTAHIRKLNKNSYKISKHKHSNDTPAHILYLPNELLEKILANCSSQDQANVGKVCFKFKFLYKNFIRHKYKLTIKRIISLNQSNSIGIILNVFRILNKSFVQLGDLHSFFYDGFINFWNYANSPKKPLLFSQLIHFSHNFFKFAERKMNESQLRIAFLTSTLRLLNSFKEINKNIICDSLNRLNVTYTLDGIWLTVVASKNLCSWFNYPEDRYSVIIILAVLLIADKLNKKYYKTMDGKTKLFVFGNQQPKISTKTIFDIDIHGENDIIEHFGNIYKNKIESMVRIKDKFSGVIRICCSEAFKYGSRRNQQMEI